MHGEFENSVQSIGQSLRRIVSLLDRDSRSMLKRYRVTGTQSVVIRSLCVLPEPQSAAALSRRLGMTPSNMTGIIDRLEEMELVRRSPKHGDRRAYLIELTEKGREFGRSLPDPTQERLMAGFADLKPAEVTRIRAALRTITGALSDAGTAVMSADGD